MQPTQAAAMATDIGRQAQGAAQSLGNQARIMMEEIAEDAVNTAERVTGLDLDGDGDVGEKGKWGKFKDKVSKMKHKYEQSDDNPYQCFRLAQCCSWWVILLCSIIFFVTLGCITAADQARIIICKRPEIVAGINGNVTTCAQALSCFAECNDQYDVITTSRFRDCFLGNAESSVGGPLSIDSPCSLAAGTLAYNVAQYYRNSSVDADLARTRFREEIMLDYKPADTVASRRRQAAEEEEEQEVRSPLAPTGRAPNPIALAWAMAADVVSASLDSDDAVVAAAARAAVALQRFGSVAPSGGSPERRLVQSSSSGRSSSSMSRSMGGSRSVSGSGGGGGYGSRRQLAAAMSPQQELLDAQANTAAAVGITFIASGKLSFVYGWVATLSVLLMVPACLMLYALAVCGKHVCKAAGRVEMMHNGSMKWAFHTAWVLGTAFILLCACTVTKFQILLRYYTTTDAACDTGGEFCSSAASVGTRLERLLERPGAAAAVTVPCALGIVAGIFPVCLAMIVSRSRTLRNEAMSKDQGYQRRLQKPGKELSAPQPVLQGPPPNLAMLNPVFETGGGYAQNYAASGNPSDSEAGGSAARL
jgi:hypothetical protein